MLTERVRDCAVEIEDKMEGLQNGSGGIQLFAGL